MMRKKQRHKAIRNLRDVVAENGFKLTIPEATAILRKAGKMQSFESHDFETKFPVKRVNTQKCGCCSDEVVAVILFDGTRISLPFAFGAFAKQNDIKAKVI